VSVKLFILGRPGSGKSTAYRQIKNSLEEHFPDWSIVRYHDYQILQSMFLYEKSFCSFRKDKQFRETEYGGFDVLDFTVLDKALKNLEKQVRYRYSPLKDELIVIEFARDDYKYAFKQFSTTFLKDAYFVFIEADIKACIQRVKDRVTNPPTQDNHFVSEDILIKYYGKHSTIPKFKSNLHVEIDKKRVKTINSRGSLEAFNAKVEGYIKALLDHAQALPPPQVKVPDPKVLTRLPIPVHR
jgi:shikimate kinase